MRSQRDSPPWRPATTRAGWKRRPPSPARFLRRGRQTPSSVLPNSPACALLEGVDKNKDQSYFLALLSQDQLRDARFPIGDLRKPELRNHRRRPRTGHSAKKRTVRGICFIGEVKMQDFLRAYVPDVPGPIVRRTDGKEIGRHRGLHYYTIDSARGSAFRPTPTSKPNVVVGKRIADHSLLVAFDTPDAPGLFVSEVRVQALSWIGGPMRDARALEGRVRYRDPRIPLEFFPESTAPPRSVFARHNAPLLPGRSSRFTRGNNCSAAAFTCRPPARRRAIAP